MPAESTLAVSAFAVAESAAATPAVESARFLEQLYFYYGRYLAISSNRELLAPNNLQGIWNNMSNAPWNSDVHTNINIQMNYWPTEPTNLSELHLPLLDYIIQNAGDENWQKAARKYAGVENGWTVFTESSLFGGMSIWAFLTMSQRVSPNCFMNGHTAIRLE